jgi:hypothetical protein
MFVLEELAERGVKEQAPGVLLTTSGGQGYAGGGILGMPAPGSPRLGYRGDSGLLCLYTRVRIARTRLLWACTHLPGGGASDFFDCSRSIFNIFSSWSAARCRDSWSRASRNALRMRSASSKGSRLGSR